MAGGALTENEKLRRALAHLQAQRATLGDEEVRAASTVLLQRLAQMNEAGGQTGRLRERGIGPRFAGRLAELRVIMRRVEQLAKGQGRYVSIEGELGVGKSRLVAEVREHFSESKSLCAAQWLEGSAGSEGRAPSYGLFAQIVLQYADITEKDGLDDGCHELPSRVEGVLRRRCPEVASCLATMTVRSSKREGDENPSRSNGDVSRDYICQAAQVFFESLAREKPLVLVLDDLQWIDECSLELLLHILPLMYRTPLLILGISRPTNDPCRVRLREVLATAYHDRYEEISLACLSYAESTQLVADLFPAESQVLLLKEKVLEETGGNPLSIQHRVRSLIHIDYDRPYAYTPQRLIERILATRNAIVGDRKFVTMLCADMAGFLSKVEEFDLPDFQQIMNGCFRIIMDEVYKYDGTVHEFRGDGILAVFGAPVAFEDHAQRACYAALAIQKALIPYGKKLKRHYGIDFGVRVGLHSGPVVVDSVADDLRTELRAHEETAERARRMESSAAPGMVLVSEQTYRLARNLFDFDALGKVNGKGQDKPVEAYVLRDTADKLAARAGREVSSTMVGRDQELSVLELQILKAVNGEGSVINVSGDAGIGKSRLLTELKQRDLRQRVRFLEGRAISIGKNLSFHPVIDLLKQWARVREDDSQEMALTKVETAIRTVCSDRANEVFPFVATMMGFKLTGKHADRVSGIVGEPLEKLVIKNVRELLVKSTSIAPIVIIMEDMHWADASSMLLLESLYRLTLTHRIVFINVFRPGYWDTMEIAPETLKERSPALRVVEVVILPLNPQTSESLVNDILDFKQLPSGLRQQIVERSGGNPFFIEEIVRSLIDEGLVRAGDSGFEVSDQIHSVVIPPTINEVLMARIDRLDEESRNLVKIASILGRSFFHRVLAELATSVEGLEDKLQYLKQIQIIREHMRMDEVEYAFQHALVQEAAYESIPLPKRRQLHLKVAQSIERIFKESFREFYGMLAYHYGRDDSPEKAEEFLIKAGEEALKSAASNEALHYYQEALGIYRMLRGDAADPAKVAMLEKNIGLALFNRGHYIDAVKHFDEALNHYWRKLPGNALTRGLLFLRSFATFLLAVYFPSRYFKKLPTQTDIEVVDLYCKKAEALVVIDPKRFFIEFFYFHATAVQFDFTKFNLGIGIFAGASPLFVFTGLSLNVGRKILDYAKPRLSPSDAKQLIRYDLVDTQHHFLKGNWSEITQYDEALVNKVLRIGEMWDAAQHYYWHGLPEICRGRFDAARHLVSRLCNIAEAYENDIYHLLKHLLNTYLFVECNDTDRANSELDQGIALVQKKGWGLSEFNMYSLKAWIHLSLKQSEEAWKLLKEADRIRCEVKVVPIQLAAFYRSQLQYHLQGLADSMGAGSRKESSEHRRHASTFGKRLVKTCRKAALYRTDSYRLMGTYHWLTQDRREAVKWWQQAVEEGQRLDARPQLARTYAEMAARAGSVRNESSEPFGQRADAYLAEARAMFIDLGLFHDMEELNSRIESMAVQRSAI